MSNQLDNMGMTQFSNGTVNFINSLIQLSKSDEVGDDEDKRTTIKNEILELNGVDPAQYTHLVLDSTITKALDALPDNVVQLH